jgi:hypothetical protein
MKNYFHHSWYKLVARGVLIFLHCTIGSVRLQCTSVNPEMLSLCPASFAQRNGGLNQILRRHTPLTYDSNYDPDYLPPVSLFIYI